MKYLIVWLEPQDGGTGHGWNLSYVFTENEEHVKDTKLRHSEAIIVCGTDLQLCAIETKLKLIERK
jgi:hypothetical protein